MGLKVSKQIEDDFQQYHFIFATFGKGEVFSSKYELYKTHGIIWDPMDLIGSLGVIWLFIPNQERYKNV